MSDVMLLGVLRLPTECWHGDRLDVIQRHGRYLDAANRIEADAETISALRLQIGELERKANAKDEVLQQAAWCLREYCYNVEEGDDVHCVLATIDAQIK